MKVVINRCFGGFSLSHAALEAIAARKGITLYKKGEGWRISFYTDPDFTEESYFSYLDFADNRADPDLVQVVESLGVDDASGDCAALKIVEIPEGVEYVIEEYDGMEHVAEVHRTWS